MITQLLDLRKEDKLRVTVGSDVGIFSYVDNTSILLTMGQFEEQDNSYRRQVNEPTHEEQEETILKQQIEIEELKEQLEIREQFEELRKEQIDEHEVF